MTRDDYRQYVPQARPARGIAFFALVLLVVAGLGHRFGPIATPEFLWLLAIVAALALVALVLAVAALRRVWREDDSGGGAAFVGLVLAMVVLAPFAAGVYGFVTYPRLYDIATSAQEPPAFRSAAQGRDPRANALGAISPEDAAAMQAAYPELVRRSYVLPVADVAQAVLRVGEARGFALVGRTDEGGSILIEFTGYSALMAFPSDVAVRLRQEGATSHVDMRSASRFGTHDQGENAARIANFLDALDYEIDVMTGLIVEEE